MLLWKMMTKNKLKITQIINLFNKQYIIYQSNSEQNYFLHNWQKNEVYDLFEQSLY